jgi:hypothetical protein
MSTDYAQMEREFLSSLKADTGRDLAAWMVAIQAQDLAHRNDIIDWLRQQGFMFARASWLERIHHNGGRPIYLSPAEFAGSPAPAVEGRGGAPASPGPARDVPAGEAPGISKPAALAPSAEAAGEASSLERVQRAVAVPPDAQDADVAAVLQRAKAYRPLGEHLLRLVREAVPGVRVGLSLSCIWLSRDVPFAAIAVSARDIRLGLALDGMAPPAPFTVGRPTAAPASISHVAVLTDARQVTPELIALVRRAAGA